MSFSCVGRRNMLENKDLALGIFSFLSLDDLKSTNCFSINQATRELLQKIIPRTTIFSSSVASFWNSRIIRTPLNEEFFNLIFWMKIEFRPKDVEIIQLDTHKYRLCESNPSFNYMTFDWTSNGLIKVICRNTSIIRKGLDENVGGVMVTKYYDRYSNRIPDPFPLSGEPIDSPSSLLTPVTVKNIVSQLLSYTNAHVVIHFKDRLTGETLYYSGKQLLL